MRIRLRRSSTLPWAMLHLQMPRAIALFLGLSLALLSAIAFVHGAAAQQLAPALCPAGGPNPFNIRPTLARFVPGQPGIPLLRRTIDTATYPEARCNDGSPAVMYIRPANAAYAGNPIIEESSKWVIFLDGGGGCRDADACLLTRWCSWGSAPFDRAGKMSSRGAWPAISVGGIFELSPSAPAVNQFADFNHVLVHYCSSDNWIGSSRLSGINTSTGIAYDIAFRGEAIVNAVFATLLSGPTAADPLPSRRFYDTPLPDLRAASEIWLVGESAGGVGLRHHLDRLREDVLEPALADPEAVIRGIVDAAVAPGMWDPAISWADPYSPGDYRDHLLSVVEPTVRNFWGANDSTLDQTCLDPMWTADHDAIGGSHPQVCYDTTYTLLHHITTPVFVRMDIDDPLAKDPYVQWNLFSTIDDYWSALFGQLDDFSAYTPAAGGLERPLETPGIQGPNCMRHVALQTNDGFFRHRVTGPGVPPHPFHDLIVNWANGLGPGLDTQQIQTDNLGAGAYSPSFCP